MSDTREQRKDIFKSKYGEIKKIVEENGMVKDLSMKSSTPLVSLSRFVYFRLCYDFDAVNFHKSSCGSLVNKKHDTVIYGLGRFKIYENQSHFREFMELYLLCKDRINKSNMVNNSEIYNELINTKNRLDYLLSIFVDEIEVESEGVKDYEELEVQYVEVKPPKQFPHKIKNKKGQFTKEPTFLFNP